MPFFVFFTFNGENFLEDIMRAVIHIRRWSIDWRGSGRSWLDGLWLANARFQSGLRCFCGFGLRTNFEFDSWSGRRRHWCGSGRRRGECFGYRGEDSRRRFRRYHRWVCLVNGFQGLIDNGPFCKLLRRL